MSITDNRKAFYNYEIVEKFEAGIALEGNEVKSIRKGKVNIAESFVLLSGSKATIHNMHIEPFEKSSSFAAEPTRIRTLLLHKEEMKKLLGKSKEKGLTIVPLSLYFKKNYIKISIGLAKGKNTVDKRDTIKKRTQDREIARAIKGVD